MFFAVFFPDSFAKNFLKKGGIFYPHFQESDKVSFRQSTYKSYSAHYLAFCLSFHMSFFYLEFSFEWCKYKGK
jgi:hypothetical protein